MFTATAARRAFWCFLPLFTTVAAAQTAKYAVCVSQRTTENKLYLSPVLETAAAEPALIQAFQAWLAEKYQYAPKYGYIGYFTCTTGLDRSQGETMRKSTLRNAGSGTVVVETDWPGPPGSKPASGPVPAAVVNPRSIGLEEGRWQCASGAEKDPVYVTPVWDGTQMPAEVQNAFEQMLRAKYGYSGRVSCSRADMVSTMATIEAGHEAQYTAWEKSGRKIVRTGWTFVPEKASLPHRCWAQLTKGQGPKRTVVIYDAGVQQIPGSTLHKLTAAWNAHLESLNPGAYYPSKGCSLVQADPAAAEASATALLDSWKQSKAEIVRVDWTWKPD